MILDIIIYLFGFLIGLIANFSNMIAGGWSVWPDVVLNGLTYFFSKLMIIDFLLNIEQLLTMIQWFIGFLVAYFSIKLLYMAFGRKLD